jgi:hypothetical protein
MRTEIVGPPDLDWADDGEKGLATQFLKTRGATAGTRNRPAIGIRRFALQQSRQGRSAGPMHGGTHGDLDTLQIETAVEVAIAENNAQQLIYFAGDFLLDDLGRFFS